MAQARSLYRQLLRTALLMPDSHRTNLVVFRARTEFDLARKFAPGTAEAADALLEGELYLDNLQHQAAHLGSLSSRSLLIPVNLRQSPSTSAEPLRRRLLAAFQARSVNNKPRIAKGTGDRFMQGPEPSWLRKEEGEGERKLKPRVAPAAGAHAHSHAHGHAHTHTNDGKCCG